MSNGNDKEIFDAQQNEQVQLYRRQKAQQFKLNISDTSDLQNNKEASSANEPVDTKNASAGENEITSFSNEDAKAQIEKDSKKTLKAEEREAKKVRKIKEGRNKTVYRFAWLLLIAIVTFILAEFFVSAFNDVFAVYRTSNETVTVIISKGDDVDSISQKLEEKGVIDSADVFTLFLNITGKGDQIEPGVYEIGKNKDYLGVVNFLRNMSNRKTTITLQFAEDLTVLEVADKLYDAGVTSDKDKFLSLCNSDEFDESYSFIADIKDDPDRLYKLEGYLFPDTYEFYVDEDPKLTVSRFLNNFKVKVFETKFEVQGYSELMTVNDLAIRTGKTVDEVVNMGAMIQCEAASVEDMYNVSSVIHNRLDFGAQHNIFSLGMDSTHFYPYGSKDEIPDDIKDTFTSAYETYNSEGLPPGAICSPGLDAIKAAVMPNKTGYFYFCHGQNSDGSVTAYYAKTISEHQNNLRLAGLV